MKPPMNHKDMENLKDDVQSKFAEIRNALQMREKLLLRQADVIMQQTKQQQLGCGLSLPSTSSASASASTSSPTTETREVKFLPELEEELLTAIRNFGRFQLDNINLTLQDVYLRNEDYITPVNDHETMYKCLQQNRSNNNLVECNDLDTLKEEVDDHPEAIVVDFSRNKSLIEHNTKHMNKSIINITLQEAKELIKKAKLRRETPIPPLNLEELDDELESSIADAVSSLGHNASSSHNTNYDQSTSNEENATKSSKKTSNSRFKPKITINNCNGTINLRNISNLTINCATEDSISAQIPFQQTEKEESTPPDVNELVSSSRNQNKSSESSITNTTQKSATMIEAVMSSADDSPTPTTTASSSNYSSSSSSRSQSKKQKGSINKKSQSLQDRTYPYDITDCDDRNNIESHAVTCDFYNRLLKEIKNSLRSKRTNDNHTQYCDSNDVQGRNENPEASGSSKITNISECPYREQNSNCSSYVSVVPPPSLSAESASGSRQPGVGRRLVLKNFENLRIVLEANSSDEETFHPVQIEQWLAEIISETDLEPMQNTDILEHSKINKETV